MICFNRDFLTKIGVTAEDLGAAVDGGLGGIVDGRGIATSQLMSFGGSGNGGRDLRALLEEPKPRTLLLVGMSDRYNASDGLATVTQLCVDATGCFHRLPTSDEAEQIAMALAYCAHPCAQAIRLRVLAFTKCEGMVLPVLPDPADKIDGCHKISLIIIGNRDAVARKVRDMLDDAGFVEVAFRCDLATRAELEEKYRQQENRDYSGEGVIGPGALRDPSPASEGVAR